LLEGSLLDCKLVSARRDQQKEGKRGRKDEITLEERGCGTTFITGGAQKSERQLWGLETPKESSGGPRVRLRGKDSGVARRRYWFACGQGRLKTEGLGKKKSERAENDRQVGSFKSTGLTGSWERKP